jgi:nucleoside-diphosphate-sugar epimerase/phosphohistidine swiveling domain-containing protein
VKIAVTGASGVLGRGIAARLRWQGHKVVGLARHRPDNWFSDADFVEADIRDADGVRRAIDGAEAVAHCAWVAGSTPDERMTHDVNIGGTENVLDAMTRAGSQRIVFASSAAAYGPRPPGTPPLTETEPLAPSPDNLYGLHKVHVEQMLADSGKEWVAIRPAIVVGREVSNAILRLLASPAFPDVNGLAERSLQIVHTEDVHRTFVRAVLGSETGPLNLAAAGEPTWREITEAIGRRMVPVNETVLDAALRALYRRGLVRVSPADLDLLLNFPVMDTSRLRREWDYTPAWDARECLDDFKLAVRGRVSLGTKVLTVPWRVGFVQDIPGPDEPPADGAALMAAGPDGLNGEFDTPVDRRFPTFVAANLSEALPGPFSPSSASVTVRGVRAGGVSVAERLNATGVLKRQMMTRLYGVFAHRLYAGVTPLYYMAEVVAGVNPESSMKPFFGNAFGDTAVFGAERPPIEHGGLGRRLRTIAGLGATAVGLIAGSGRESRAYVADVDRLERLTGTDVEALGDARLEGLISLARDLVMHGWVLTTWAAFTCTATANATRVLAGGTSMPLAGPDLPSARALGSVRRLLAAARRDPVALEILAGEQERLGPLKRRAAGFYRVLLDELAVIGHRGPGECELDSRSYADDPEQLLGIIAKAVAAGGGADAAAHDRPEAKVPIHARPAAWLAAWQMRDREIRRDKVVRATWVVRRLLRELGRRLVERGILADIDDVFYLLVDEMLAVPPDIRSLVAHRRAERAKLAEVTPPSSFWGSWAPQGQPPLLAAGQSLSGMGVSGGRTRGRVRIVNETTIDDLQSGEVLVAEVTDVGYTPAFEIAAAVVTNLGGPMSHAAIVAREFGVTCVVDAPDATRRLVDGALIEVDGSTGEIRVLDMPVARAS